jgi:hypothetical protein
MEVNFTWLGLEEYYLNGQLLRRQWNFSLAGQREFNVGPHLVRIEISAQPNQYFTRVFLDGELYIEELFPHFRAVFAADKPIGYLLPALAGALVAALVALWLSGVFTK